MTTYNTGNPVGSTDVRDLYDNTQNLDSLVNGPLTSYADRLGAPRKSWRGIEQDFAAFLAASGFELPALEYVGGSPLVVDRPTQLIFRTGFPDTLYGVKSTEPFPATLTGTWATDESRLVVRSDGDLRQDLANSTDPAKGAGLVGYSGSGDYPQGTVGSRLKGVVVTVESYGASPLNPDNTAAYAALVADVPEGSIVRWASPGKVYIGNFSSPTKSLRLDLNGAILRNSTTTAPVVSIGSLTGAVAHPVVDQQLVYGATSFEVAGASGIFSAGDIGYLWDSATRSDGQAVNFETVKIKSVSGDVVSIDGFLASYKGAGAIKFYHDPNQLKGAAVFGGTIAPSADHVSMGVGVFSCEGVFIDKINTTGTTGSAVDVRFCYDVNTRDVRCVEPNAIGSGQGYGVALWAVSQFTVANVFGRGMRHVYDQDSAYFGSIRNITDMDDKSACVILAHNGFTGHIDLKGVVTKTVQYTVILSGQGYSGATAALRGNHPFRNIRIKNVDATIDATVDPNTALAFGVYFANSVVNCSVEKIECNVLNMSSITPSSGTAVVRVDGVAKGTFKVSEVYANRVGCALFTTGHRGGLPADASIAELTNIHLGVCARVARLQGSWAVALDNIVVGLAPAAGVIVEMEANYGDVPRGAYVGQNIWYQGAEVPIVKTTSFMPAGVLPTSGRGVGSDITVAGGQEISQAELQNRSRGLRLVAPIGTGTTTLSATAALPPPIVQGQEAYIATFTGRHSVVLPAGGNIHTTITIAPGEQIKIVGYAGKWALSARSASV